MHKTLTITLDEEIYTQLHKHVGHGQISRFIEDLLRPHVLSSDLEAGYKQMAQDDARESEALEWSEATIGDVADDTR
ncbi:MAG: hypothetical protein ACI8V2_002189 [Candidatus Latescibacterota bacterium]|jgi:hypothetical protein